MKSLLLALSFSIPPPLAVFDVSFEENHHGGELPENQMVWYSLSREEADRKVQELFEMADSFQNDVMVIRVEKRK